MTRPANILLIHSDQHRFDCLGVNGLLHGQWPTEHGCSINKEPDATPTTRSSTRGTSRDEPKD